MKNRASVLLIALFFGGLALLWIADRRHHPAPRVGDGRPLTALSELTDADVKTIEFTEGGTKLRFERRGDDWQIVRPIDAQADRSKLGALVTSVRSLSTRPDAGEVPGPARDYGLQPPRQVLTVTPSVADSPPIRLKLGELRRDYVYVQVDDDPTIRVVPSAGLNDLASDVDSWRARDVFPVPSHEVERLAFDREGTELAIEHDAGTWKIVSPFRAPAEDPKVETLVAAVLGLRVAADDGFVADGATDLKPYGLDPPRLRIEVTTGQKDPVTRSIRLGAPIPNRPGLVYAIAGNQDDVVAIDRSRVPAVESLALQLRNTEVANVDFDTATSLHVNAGNVNYVLTRTRDGWNQSAPVAVAGDSRVILEYLAHLGGLHALKIVPASEAESTGLDHPSARIEVWHVTLDEPASGAADVILSLGRFDPEQQVLYGQVKNEPNVLSLPATSRALIPSDPLTFADRSVHAFPANSIAGLKIRQGGRSVALHASDQSRDYEHWSMTEPVQSAVDAPAVSSLDAVLSTLRAESRLSEGDPSAAGLNHPWLEIQWALRDGETGTLSVGAPVPDGNGSRYAKSSLSTAPFTLSRSVLDILDAEFHDRSVLRIPEDTIESIKTTSEGATRQWRREPRAFREANWNQVGCVGLPGPTGEIIGRFAKSLQDLQTSRFLQYQGEFREKWGLTDGTTVIDIERSSGLKPQRLRIGSAIPGGSVAATTSETNEGPVFLLSDSVVAPLMLENRLPSNVFEEN